MSINLNNSESKTRENRLGSITGYSGNLKDLSSNVSCGCLGNRERCFNQASQCNAACALSQLSFITDAAVVHHSPAGCAVTAMQVSNSKDQLAAKLDLDNSRSAYVCTDMNEADTVFGATDNLREVIIETYNRYKPSAIFIGASCVSGVIGEDLDSIADDLKEEVPIPIAPVHCEGFRTKIWASGFDAAYHAILTSIVKEPEKKSNKVNVINFFGGARDEITKIFGEFGVEPVFLLANSSVEELSMLSEALATVSSCGTLGTYLGNALQEKYGVPYVKSLQPHGIAGFESWLRGLGKAINKEEEVERYIKREREKYLPKIQGVKECLEGLRAVIGMGPSFNFNTTRALQELGIEIAYSAAWHFDKEYDDGKEPDAFRYLIDNSPNNYKINVSDLQNHELLNILNTVKPDIFFSRHSGSTVWAMKLGIPALCVYDEYAIFGYRGLINFAYSILDIVTNRSYTENLSKRVKLPYTNWWFSQSNDFFIDKEALL